MIVIPAIDLIRGQCVRLKQGDYENKTIYSASPFDRVQAFEKLGYQDLHLVDLDAAKNPEQNQYDLITQLTQSTALVTQVGGGIRSWETLEFLIKNGVQRVVIGSLTVKQPSLVQSWIQELGADRIVLALDVRCHGGLPYVLTSAWQEESHTLLWDLIDAYPSIQHILCTDISCDGMMQGPHFALYEEALSRYPEIQWQASGGIRHQEDIDALRERGLSAAIVGKALYESETLLC